ncbi:MAG: GrpB family protein [Asgard group archaeon]|nr:GrpB family protein [Asgard group archaeon]
MKTDENVTLVEPDSNWKIIFQQEANLIRNKIGSHIKSIEHIGSTALPRIAAKPIIDILIGIDSLSNSEKIVTTLQSIDYVYNQAAEVLFPERLLFQKSDVESKQQFNLHIVVHHSDYWKDIILFRDYLLTHPEALKEYELVKKHMAVRFPTNLVAYSIGKEGYIVAIIARAKNEMK